MLGKTNTVVKKVYYDLRHLLFLCVSVAHRMTAGTGLASKDTRVGGARQIKAHKTWYISMCTRRRADKERKTGLKRTQ